MEYVLLKIKISPLDPFRDYLSYELANCGFDMFEESPGGLMAYALNENYQPQTVEALTEAMKGMGAVLEIKEELIPWKNWNEEWEKSFSPEIIDDTVYIRADFHPPNPGFLHEIIIQPRMAFGTGHHPTTAQVMSRMLKMDFTGKRIIDMGCGTGILAILALQRGAGSALAIDNDPNAAENSRENALKNNFPDINVQEGDASLLYGHTCDLFIANINRNIILQDIASYARCLNQGGYLLTSGYYEQDLPMIREAASRQGLEYRDHTQANDWCCACFQSL
jgi:ribosomal protein L11 methyltransferase